MSVASSLPRDLSGLKVGGTDLTDGETEVLRLLARGLTRPAHGGGDATETITTHLVPLAEIESWLAAQRRDGRMIDLKIFSALWFLRAGSRDISPT